MMHASSGTLAATALEHYKTFQMCSDGWICKTERGKSLWRSSVWASCFLQDYIYFTFWTGGGSIGQTADTITNKWFDSSLHVHFVIISTRGCPSITLHSSIHSKPIHERVEGMTLLCLQNSPLAYWVMKVNKPQCVEKCVLIKSELEG